MQWFSPEAATVLAAPEFQLATTGGQVVTRSQFRQRKHLVLVFVPDPDAPDVLPVVAALEAVRDELAEASAVLFFLGEPPLPPPSWLIDPGDAVRQAYAALFPRKVTPGDTEPFVVILSRYGVPEFVGRGLDDAATVVGDVVARVWGLEYQCSL